MKNRNLFLIILISLIGTISNAQNYTIDAISSTVYTCSGNFYDSGGSGGGASANYGNNEDYTVTFCSNDGTHIHFDFTSFAAETNYDYLDVYDGTSTAAPLIGVLNGTYVGTVSFTSSGDCLTFQFTSDFIGTASGWAATISCAVDNPPTNGDCGNAIPVCQDTYTQNQSVTGVGSVNEIALAEANGVDDCFSTIGEHNSTWYIFTVNQTGTFEFAIQTTVDYDWGLYNVSNNSCQDIMDGVIAMTSCNWSGIVGDSTGIDDALSGSLAQFEPSVSVTAGETYVLCVDNFTGGATGYTVNLNNGTAGIYDNTPPVLQTITSAPACGDNTITFQFSENIACSSVDLSDFSLVHESGYTYTLTDVTSVECSAGSANSSTFTITLSENMIAGGTYTLSLVGQVEDACNNTISTNSLSFGVTGVVANITNTYPSCFGSSDASITASASGGTSPYSYTWSTGSTASTITGLAAGTYTVTVTDFGGVCEDVRVINITNTIVLYTEDFDPNAAGWTHGALAGTDTWAIGDPMGGNGSSGLSFPDPVTDHTSTNTNNNVYGQGLGAGSGTDCAGGAYCNSSNEWLRSPVINCTGKTNVHLTFYRWANFEVSFDEAYVEVSTNGTTWNDLGHPLYPQDNTWTFVDLDASAYADNQATVYFRWRMESDGSVTYSGWNIDDVVVTADLVELVAAFSNTTNVACFGGSTGSTDITISGGTPLFDVNWLNGGSPGSQNNLGAGTTTLSGLSSGNYNVTVTDDSGCTETGSFSISQPVAALSASASPTNVACYGATTGAVNLTVSGGTTAYSYIWNSGQTTEDLANVGAGNYSVTITDANGCTTTAATSVTQPAAGLSASISKANVSCFGGSNGSATVTVSGGTAGYSYDWAPNGFTGDGTTSYTGLSAGTYTVTATDANGCTITSSTSITQPASALSASISGTNVLCFGQSTGAANLTASGGTPAYTFNWSNGSTNEDLTNLASGTYTVTVTDANSCTATTSVGITQPASALSASAVAAPVACFGASTGSVNLTVAGGTPSYTYSWNSGQTTEDLANVSAAAYAVTVSDANGCTATASATVTQPASGVSATISKVNVACFGGSTGSATVSPSGGTPGYTYDWAPNGGTGDGTVTYSGLQSGTYTVTVTDAGSCTFTISTTITQPASGVSASIAGTNVLCFGQSTGAANVTAIGGTPSYTYNWSNGSTNEDLTNIASGSYTVTVTDANSCTTTATTSITQPASALSASAAATAVACFGGSTGSVDLSPAGGTPSYTYSWNGGQTTQDLTNVSAGGYSVTVTDANSCTATASATVTQPASGVSASISKVNVACFGGSTGSATVTPSGGTAGYTYDWSPNGYSGDGSATYSGLIAGTYTVTVSDANSCSFTISTTVTQPAAALAASIAGTNVNCFGETNGAADLTVTGGTTPYTYLWASSQTTQDLASIAAGGYQVTVTDANSCTATANITITQPTVLTAPITFNDANCFGICDGDATATPAGGTSPYTYAWDDALFQSSSTAANLCDGTYNVTVTDSHNCTVTGSATIGEPTEIILVPSSGQANCGANTGSASIAASGGAGGYSYDWVGTPTGDGTANIINLYGGTYTVTVTDANLCQVVTSVNVSESGAPTATITATTNVSCNGGANGSATVTLSAATVGDYEYAWSTGTTNMSSLLTDTETGLSQGAYSVTITDNNGTGCATNASFVITEPSLLNASINTQTNVNCFGNSTGAATVSVSGGTAGYTYSWSAGAQTTQTATALSAGTFIVTVSDANFCTATAQVTITEPAAALNPTIAATDVDCFGGSDGGADLTVTGGTTAYSYAWSNASTNQDLINIAAGTYTVTVTDSKGCTASTSAAINEPLAALSIDAITPTAVNCFNGTDGQIDITVSGGTTAYTYLWNTGQSTEDLSGLTAGNFEVTVTDANGCFDVASTTVTQPAASLSSTITGTNVGCSGGTNGSVNLTVSNGTPGYTYLWSNAATTEDLTGVAAGSYTVTVSDANSCTTTNTYTVTQPAGGLNLTFTTIDVTCQGLSNGSVNLSVSGGTTPYTYAWDSGQTSQDLTNVPAADYTVTVTDANLCTATITASITEPAAALSIDNVVVQNVACFNGLTGAVDITVSGGTTPYSFAWNSGQTTEDLSGISAGSYDILVTDANGCSDASTALVSQPAAALSSTISGTNVSCSGGNDGAVNLTVSNGTPGYTYLWSNSATTEDLAGVTAGTYTVTVSDANSCTTTNLYTVTQPGGGLNLSFTVIDVPCFGLSNGSVNLSVSGGTTPYSYSWDSGPTSQDLTNVPAADYTVTVTDANLCTSTTTATVGQPAAALAIDNILVTDVGCFNAMTGAVDITVIGGTTPYSYAWNSGQTTEDLSGLSAGTYDIQVTDANNCQVTGSANVSQPAAALSVSIAGTNVSCNGGSDGTVNITVTDGTPGYTYLWSNSATTEDLSGVVAGTYTVTISDANGCTASISRTVTQPANPLATSIVSVDVECFGENTGSIDLTVTGGTTPYSYSWDSGQTGQDLPSVPAGAYAVTVTDSKGCTAVDNVTITEHDLLVASIVGTNILCRGQATGAADLTVTGGAVPYSYLWNYGQTTEDLSNIAAGAYDVVVSDDHGCTAVAAVNITQPATVVTANIPFVNITDILCFGNNTGEAIVNASGGTGVITYDWSPDGFTGDGTNTYSDLTAGIYNVTVSDANGCTATAGAAIDEPAAGIVFTVDSYVDVLCTGLSTGQVTTAVTGGTSPYTYTWSPVGFTGGTTAVYSNLPAGDYFATITDAGGCSATISQTISEPALALTGTTSTVNSSCGNSDGSASIVASGGVLPYTYSWTPAGFTGPATADYADLPAGSYTIIVTDANSCTYSQTVNVVDNSSPVIDALVSTNVSCNGAADGTATVTASGGVAPLTYAWSNAGSTNSISGLSGGSYTITVTDSNGCLITGTTVVSEPTALASSFFVTDIDCNGDADGTIDLTPSGGTTPYTYSWSGGQATQDLLGQNGGTYTVTITDANGCQLVSSSSIAEPTALTTTIAATHVNCFGDKTGAADLTPGGGTPPYTYQWSNLSVNQDIAPLFAGWYYVTVQDDNGCIKRDSVQITQPVSGIALSTVVTNVTCNGQSDGAIDLIPTGGAVAVDYVYNWSNSQSTQDLSGLPQGIYAVTVTDDNGCSKVTAATVNQPTALSLDMVASGVLCTGSGSGDIDITAGGGTPYTVSPAYQYVWSTGSTSEDLTGMVGGTYTVTVTDSLGCSIIDSVNISEPSGALALAFTGVDALCFGGTNGSVNMTVTGGTPTYSYSWSNAAIGEDLINVTAGTYDVTVTDANGCTETGSYTVNEPAAALAISNAVPVDASCFGSSDGSISMDVTGGTSPYTYSWNFGYSVEDPSNIPAETHIVIVTDANGCTATETIVVGQPTAITATSTTVDPSCGASDGQATIIPVGGSSPYTFFWSAGGQTTATATGLSAGTHYVTITDANGCQNIRSIYLSNFGAPTLVFAASTNVDCYGNANGSATVIPSGGTPAAGLVPYTYNWSDGQVDSIATGLSGGIFDVTVTDDVGCIATGTISIVEPDTLIASITPNPVDCYGLSSGVADLVLSGGTPAYTYNWSNGGTTQDQFGLSAGTYSVTITDLNGCTASAIGVITEPAAALQAFAAATGVTCYGAGDGSVDLFANGGTLPYTYNWNYGQTTEDISGLTGGNYSVTVSDVNGCTASASANVTSASPISVYSIASEVSCYSLSDGGVNLTVSGGTMPFSFNWSSGDVTEDVTGLPAGIHYFTVTDFNGCTKLDSVEVIQPDTLSATYVAKNVKCYGGKDGVIDLHPEGGKVVYSFNWENGAVTEDRINLFPGTYSVTVTDGAGCTITETITISQPDTAIYIQSEVIDNPCFGDALGQINLLVLGGTPQLPDSTYLYQWNHGQINDTITNLDAGTYEVTVTDYNLCTVVDTFVVSHPAQIVLSATNTGAACGLNNGTATVTPTGGVGPYSYLWSNALTDQTIIDLAGNQYYSVTVTDANGCSKNTVTFVDDEGNPTVFISSTVDVTCYQGTNGEAIAVSAGGTPPYNFSWSSGDVGANVTGLAAGSYVVSVSDANGCQNSYNFTIDQPDSLYAILNVVGAGCYGDSSGTATLNLIGQGSGFPYSYLWSTGETTAQIFNLPSGSYAATITDGNGCVFATDTVVVPQPSAPLALTYTVANLTCNSSHDGVIDLTVTGGTQFSDGSYDYYWSYGAFTEDVNNLISGNYYVTVVDSAGCNIRDSILVTEPLPLDIQFVTTASNCGFSDGTSTLNVVTGGTAPHTWEWSNGQTDTVATGLPTGLHFISITDANLCTAEFEIYVGLQGTNYVNIVPAQILCNGEMGGATATMPDGIAPFTFEWQDTTGNVLEINIGNGTIDSLLAGQYTVYVVDSIGCSGENSFTINEAPSLLRVNVTPLDASCKGDTDGQVLVTGLGGTPMYSVTVIDANTSVPVYTTTNVSSATASGLAPGPYDIVVIDANGCRKTTNTNINEPNYMIPYYSVVDANCYGSKDGIIQAEPEGGNGGYQYVWSTSQTTSAAINLYAGTYTCTITDMKGCDTILIAQVGQPSQLASTDTMARASCIDNNDGWVRLTVTGGIFPYTYNWNNGQTDYEAVDLEIGEYTVTVTDDHGCTHVDTVEVGYWPGQCVEIPSGFTPQGDGENDTWMIRNIELYDEVTVKVFNRWGDLMFEYSGSGLNYNPEAWDGKYQGRDVPIGPYMFIVDLMENSEPIAGTVTVLR